MQQNNIKLEDYLKEFAALEQELQISFQEFIENGPEFAIMERQLDIFMEELKKDDIYKP